MELYPFSIQPIKGNNCGLIPNCRSGMTTVKTISKNYIGLFATKSAPPIYIIYVHEKSRTSKNIDRC